MQDGGAKPLRRALEAQPRTRGGFEEQRAHRGAGQRTAAFAVDEGLRAVQQRDQDVARQAFEREQVAQAAVGVELRCHVWPMCKKTVSIIQSCRSALGRDRLYPKNPVAPQCAPTRPWRHLAPRASVRCYPPPPRTEERRAGKRWVMTCRTRGSP